MRTLLLSTLALYMICLSHTSITAQTLDAFERSANKPVPANEEEDDDNDSIHDDPLSEALLELIGAGIIYGGSSSWLRTQADKDACTAAALTPRETGDRQIPFARADFSYQDLGSGIDAHDYRAETGYGPVGLNFSQTHYREENPRDRLDLIRLHVLYRMSFGDSIELDSGFGTLWINGNELTSRFSFTMPILIYPNDLIGIEFRPAWAANVRDYDLGLLVGGSYSSLKAGYRWTKSPDETLHGPYIGLAVHF